MKTSRQIKLNRFRVWITEDIESMFMNDPYIRANRMIYPNVALDFDLSIDFGGRVFFVDWNYSDSYSKYLEPHQYILMQYIGIKDRNRVEIYELDIVEHNTFDGRRDRLVANYQRSGGYNGWNITELNMFDSGYEVVGNIYQNPEMYKEMLYGKS